tara:strand:+ start:643 stop:2166 length:1524 start_codon:yes stop_codon:yes gene_type:complete
MYSLAELLRQYAKSRPESLCIAFDREFISFAELDKRSDRLVSVLLGQGLVAGDRVAILATNKPAFFELLFACAKSGLIMLPINWRLSAREIGAIIVDASPRCILSDQDLVAKLPPSAELVDCPLVVLGDSYNQWRDADSHSTIDSLPIDPDTTILLLYTSGTTGLPKGAMISDRNLSFHQRHGSEMWGFSDSSVNLVAMPLFHVGGIGYGLNAMLAGGATVILQQADPRELCRAIVEHKVTHSFFVPAVIQMLVDLPAIEAQDMSSLEFIGYGASPISETLLKRALEIFQCNFAHAYGLTESCGTVLTLLPEFHDPEATNKERLRSCGRPVPWAEVALFDLETMLPVAQGEVGEICIRSGMTVKGYWNKPEATAEAITADGWLRTGDAAYCDDEGFFYIHDRYKDMIVSGGENIYPTEVENILYEHPDVAETAVIGVPHPRWGETPKAIVVCKPGQTIEAAALLDFTRARLARYKCPTSVEVVEQMPRNASGKILKRELRAMIWPEK